MICEHCDCGWLPGAPGIYCPHCNGNGEIDEQPETPIDNCIHKDTDDGTCGNQKNTTPECHQWCCPELRIIK